MKNVPKFLPILDVYSVWTHLAILFVEESARWLLHTKRPEIKFNNNIKEGRVGGQVVSELAFLFNDPSSNPAEVYIIYCKKR